MDQPLKRIPLTPEQFLQLQKQFSNIPVIDYDNQKKSGITGPVKLSDEQLKILLNQLQEKSIKSIKNNDDINSDKNNNNDNNDNNDINNQKNKDENIINNDIKILDNKEDVKPGQIPGQIPVTQSIGVEIIKMFFNESMNQTPWKCIGREGRLKKLSELTEKFKIAYETAKFLTDEQKKKIDTNLLNKHIPVFFLSYFGEDVTEQIMYIVGTYKELFSLFIKEINDKANVNKEESMKKPIKKVLFISDRLSSLSSVLKDRALVIIKMTDEKDKFIVDIMTKTSEDSIGKQILAKCNKVHRFSGDTRKDINTIIDEHYDIIIYADCHMSDQASTISLFRLAPFQFSTWGHSETTGTCDGYFCNYQYETEDVKKWSHHYLEPKLFIQKSLGTIYNPPLSAEVKKHFMQRDYFSLPKGKKIYLCTSSLFKMGSEMFDIFKGILQKDQNGIIVITKMNSDLDRDFYKDMENYLGDEYTHRIRMIERQNILRVNNLAYISDVYLESYPFGNMNSSMEAFSVGLPVISWSTNKMNSRYTRGFYEKMGLQNSGLIVNSIEEFIDSAVKTANDENFKNLLRLKIQLRSELLFNDDSTYTEWFDILYNYCTTGDDSLFKSDITLYDNLDNCIETRLKKIEVNNI
jgi:predicted O-linked N-acetylglucosamine transferase (SPINDLY family)